MSIRLRKTNAGLVAICAARSVPKDGDMYLDDAAHHALAVKFDLDFASEGLLRSIYADGEEAMAIETEESNNCARDECDKTFSRGAAEPV